MKLNDSVHCHKLASYAVGLHADYRYADCRFTECRGGKTGRRQLLQ